MKQPYNTALYMRLSRDDENYGDSISIETQRTILCQFASDNDLRVVDEYVDDGWSGTSFEHPDFQRMMDDVEAGVDLVDAICALDAFGRMTADKDEFGGRAQKIEIIYRFVGKID